MPEIQGWVVAGRIASILGMGIMATLAILFLLGALWVPGIVAALVTVPFFVLMIGVERSKAAQAMSGKPSSEIESEP